MIAVRERTIVPPPGGGPDRGACHAFPIRSHACYIIPVLRRIANRCRTGAFLNGWAKDHESGQPDPPTD